MRQPSLDLRRARRSAMTGVRETLDGRPPALMPAIGETRAASAGDDRTQRCGSCDTWNHADAKFCMDCGASTCRPGAASSQDLARRARELALLSLS